MSFKKTALMLVLLTFLVTPAFANGTFFAQNKDLRRVGLDELLKIPKVGFESGNYRIDPDFRLGLGDTVAINLSGKLEATHKLAIDREGDIVIPLIGRVSLLGLTLDEARAAVKRELDKKYTNVELGLTLADVQNIRISVLGNVANPGPYAVSPFSRVVDALAACGGPNSEGSLSDVQVMRDGKVVASFNTYDFIFKADQSKNIRLQHGDLIYIPQAKNLIALRGDVRYPGIYGAEIDSTLSRVIERAGGLQSTKFQRKIIVLRMNSETQLNEIVKEIVFDATKDLESKDDIEIENYDTVIVTTALDYTPEIKSLYQTVRVTGEVKIPGSFLIKEVEKLSSALKRAGGLKTDAFVAGAVFIRNSVIGKYKSVLDELIRAQERAILEDEARLAEAILTQEEKEMRQRALEYRRKALNLMAARVPTGRIVVNLEEIMSDKSDIVLEEGDSLDIPMIPDWVIVVGAVYNPQSIAFAEGKPLEYYLNSLGGLKKNAAEDEIYIIKADGRAESKKTGFTKVSRGDIIVAPEKME